MSNEVGMNYGLVWIDDGSSRPNKGMYVVGIEGRPLMVSEIEEVCRLLNTRSLSSEGEKIDYYVKCNLCEGNGWTAEHGCMGNESQCQVLCPIQVQCQPCNATGFVPASSPDLSARVTKEPKVICFCGSSRFIAEMAILMWEFEKLGNICMGLHLMPNGYGEEKGHGAEYHHLAELEGCAEQMDELHKRKIDLANEIFVVNVGGYIGSSTKSEIEYATVHGKPVRYLEPPIQSLNQSHTTKEEQGT